MDPFVGEIRLFSGNFAPIGWLLCNGQQVNVRDYQVLYALLGNTFGGTAMQNFKVPDLTGKAPLHRGAGQGLTVHNFATSGGTTTETLNYSQMPIHDHIPQSMNTVSTGEPTGAIWGNIPKAGLVTTYNTASDAIMGPLTIGASGMTQPHNNMQPFVGITYIICWEGIYPDFND
ncbi:tail fiber protein [Paenibacillus sp. KACC 21273]|uniref:phage tail protein n=1 Tax=Paenibacillus sp. KACC 21273 TaxID=3025665 RepID=UPI00236516DB|nr:tail fiber protein [Paenibacillus sp. KACC 21273]WDF50047.1 tail fiber protein [Paenibacillus sp. KACC 21273]